MQTGAVELSEGLYLRHVLYVLCCSLEQTNSKLLPFGVTFHIQTFKKALAASASLCQEIWWKEGESQIRGGSGLEEMLLLLFQTDWQRTAEALLLLRCSEQKALFSKQEKNPRMNITCFITFDTSPFYCFHVLIIILFLRGCGNSTSQSVPKTDIVDTQRVSILTFKIGICWIN